MTKAKRVQIDLPPPLYQVLVAFQKQQSIESPSLAARRVLEQFFPLDASTPAYASQERLEELEEKVAHLFELVMQLRRGAIAQQSPELQKADSSSSLTATAASSIDLEEIDDEPDEILLDFLEPET